MKFYIDGEYVKQIPKKYKELEVAKFLTDLEHKRLQPDERDALEAEYIWKETQKILRQNRHGRLTLERLGEEKPYIALEVLLRTGKAYHVLRCGSGKEIKIPAKLFTNFPNKQIIRRNY